MLVTQLGNEKRLMAVAVARLESGRRLMEITQLKSGKEETYFYDKNEFSNLLSLNINFNLDHLIKTSYTMNDSVNLLK